MSRFECKVCEGRISRGECSGVCRSDFLLLETIVASLRSPREIYSLVNFLNIIKKSS